MEYWDIYNRDGEFMNKALPKGSSFGRDEYHMAVEAWIVNDKNQLLIQLRSEKCEILPGIWAMTTGRIISGENTLSGCIRELREELGIETFPESLTKIARFIREENHIIWDIFLVRSNAQIEELCYSDHEVAQAKWISIPEFRDMINKKKIFVYSEIESVLKMVEAYLPNFNPHICELY